MKKVYLVHGWSGNPENSWFPWLRQKLEATGFLVQSLAMPTPDEPDPTTWPVALAAAVPDPDEETIFVGHSIGCQTIMRYLAGLPEGKKIKGVVFVAPFIKLMGLETATEEEVRQKWDDAPLDFESFRSRAGAMVCLFSDDDPVVDMHTNSPFFRQLGATIVTEHAKGHFSDDAGVTELPNALNAVLKIAGQ